MKNDLTVILANVTSMTEQLNTVAVILKKLINEDTTQHVDQSNNMQWQLQAKDLT